MGQRFYVIYYWSQKSVITLYMKELIWVSTGVLEQTLPLTLRGNCNEIFTHELQV